MGRKHSGKKSVQPGWMKTKIIESQISDLDKLPYWKFVDYYNTAGQPKQLDALMAKKHQEHHDSFVNKEVAEVVLDASSNKPNAIMIHTEFVEMNSYEKEVSKRVTDTFGQAIPIFQVTTDQSRKEDPFFVRKVPTFDPLTVN